MDENGVRREIQQCGNFGFRMLRHLSRYSGCYGVEEKGEKERDSVNFSQNFSQDQQVAISAFIVDKKRGK